MLWLIATMGGVGLLLGLCLFRVHAIAILSVVMVFACVIVSLFADWTLLASAICTLASVSALQFGYLAGSGFAWSRATDAGQADNEAPVDGNMKYDGLVQRGR